VIKVPQGVMPVPQLFSVPRVVLPVVSNFVTIMAFKLASSAAGPVTVMTVSGVILRFKGDVAL